MAQRSIAIVILMEVLPKITATIAFLGESTIVASILKSSENRANMQQRLLCAMVTVDMTANITWILSNIMMPKKSDSIFLWTYGSQASCTLQGFILQFNISSMFYNAALSIYYLLVIKYQWKHARLQKVEKWMHIIPLSVGLLSAIIALCLGVYNPAGWNCWIAPNPDGSKASLATMLRFVMFYLPLWVCIAFSLLNMFRMYLHVKKEEKKSAKWKTYRGSKFKKFKHTQAVAKQGQLYFLAFIFPWAFPTIYRIYLIKENPPDWVLVVAATMIPCQGIFNTFVYFRLRFNKMRERNPDKSAFWVILQIVVSTICPGCTCQGSTCKGSICQGSTDQARNTSGISLDVEPSLNQSIRAVPSTLRTTFKSIVTRRSGANARFSDNKAEIKGKPTKETPSAKSSFAGTTRTSTPKVQFSLALSTVKQSTSMAESSSRKVLRNGKLSSDAGDAGHPAAFPENTSSDLLSNDGGSSPSFETSTRDSEPESSTFDEEAGANSREMAGPSEPMALGDYGSDSDLSGVSLESWVG